MKYFALIGIMALLGLAHVYSCTIFKATQSGKTFIGNNEDWVKANAKVWFLAATPGKHGRVLFGFENGWAQGGMNDQGLFFDGIAIEAQDWGPVSNREDFSGNLCELILEKAETVDDAVVYFKRYNFPSLVVGKFIFVDATGNTVAISYEGGRLKIGTFEASIYASGYRGEKARALLDNTQNIDIQTMRSILKACQRRDKYATRYSTIFAPLGLKVHVYPSVGAVNEVIFDLARELAKGDHYYDLARLSEQMGRELIVDHKTRPTLNCSSSALDGYVGQYGLDPNSVTIARHRNNLFVRSKLIFDAVMAIEIVPVAEDLFCARHLDVEIEFQRDQKGNLDALLLFYDRRFVCPKRE